MAFSASIICPTFNRSLLLQECVQSIFSDPKVRLELVIADDGSTDDTPSVCRKLQKTYGEECIVVSRSEDNRGAQAARNRGLRAATAGLVMFIDSDDVIVISGVAKLLERVQVGPDLDYAYGWVLQTDNKLTPLQGAAPVGGPFSNAPVEVAGYHWHTMAALYRKSYLQRVGPWNEALTGSQDWEYQARVKLAGGSGVFVDTLVGYWRQHEDARIGVKAFRWDYVSSAILACDRIYAEAVKVGRCDRALDHRLGKKLIILALELGAHDKRAARNECLRKAEDRTSDDRRLLFLIRLLRLLPSTLDGALRTTLIFLGRNKRQFDLLTKLRARKACSTGG